MRDPIIQAFEILNKKNTKIIFDLATVVNVDGDSANIRFSDGNVQRCLFNPNAQMVNGDACVVARSEKLNTWIVVCTYVDPAVGRRDGNKPVASHVPGGTLKTNTAKETFTAIAVTTSGASLGSISLDTRGGAILVTVTGYLSRATTSWASITFNVKINGSNLIIPETFATRVHGSTLPQIGFSFTFPSAAIAARNHTIELTAVSSTGTITVDTVTISALEV